MKLVLPLGDTTVELPLLWRLVLSLGGSEAVARLHLWPAIVEQLLDEAPGNEVSSCNRAPDRKLQNVKIHFSYTHGYQPCLQSISGSSGEPEGSLQGAPDRLRRLSEQRQAAACAVWETPERRRCWRRGAC